MIFATVGTQLPFPRMMQALTNIAPDLPKPIIAQTGKGAHEWPSLNARDILDPEQFEELFTQAHVIVSHAGIGTVLSARRLGKPLVMLPRRFDLSEHRNDHQMMTARKLEGLPGLHIAWEVEDLRRILLEGHFTRPVDGAHPLRDTLIGRLERFIDDI